jgi:hypothetical protein
LRTDQGANGTISPPGKGWWRVGLYAGYCPRLSLTWANAPIRVLTCDSVRR